VKEKHTMDLNERVELYGYAGTVIQFLDFHRTQAVVRWDSGSVETVPTAKLQTVPAGQESVWSSPQG
jgi:hypothetical protein